MTNNEEYLRRAAECCEYNDIMTADLSSGLPRKSSIISPTKINERFCNSALMKHLFARRLLPQN